MINIEYTSLQDIIVITPNRLNDSRGFFAETWNVKTLAAQGIIMPSFVQENHSISYKPGTVRGLHFQSPPHAQAKFVRCGNGAIFDVVVDVRKGSPSYGNWFGVILSAENGKQLWIPTGFLHGFMTLQPNSEIVYKCSEYYAPKHDGAVRWDSCGIKWPTNQTKPIISEKDEEAQRFSDFETPFEYEARK